ncbi:uncharacterized protein LOC120003981 [Tripterygium wilfordii]|nr:uncharacterized protein LOC120003981 [Tripterygium wilfordii]
MKKLLQKAYAAGTTSDLYMAYKGLEEKKESVVSSEVTDSVTLKQESADVHGGNDAVSEKGVQNKAEPDDWEDAADISALKLESPANAGEVHGGSLNYGKDGNENTDKKYSKDFLLQFAERCKNLPEGFEIASDIAEALMVDDDRWNKQPGPFGGRDPRLDIGYGSNAGFRPGRGGNYGIFKNPRVQVPVQYEGILSGPNLDVGHSSPSTRAGHGSRKNNFTPDEDILLCSAYINTSKDAIERNNQQSSTFWGRVCKYMEDNGGTLGGRSAASVESRWSEINKHCGKFIGYLSKIEMLKQSGQTEQGRCNEALELYTSEMDKPFHYHHCWEVLKDDPKWQASLSSTKQRNNNEASVDISDAVDLGDDSEPSSNQERPLERKASKEMLKKKKGEEVGEGSISTFTPEFWKHKEECEKEKADSHERALQQHQEMLHIQRQRLNMDIIQTNTSNMDPRQAAYFKQLKAKIYQDMGL